MAAFFILWMCLHVSEFAYAKATAIKVITININGRPTNKCCVEGSCLCSSMYNALSSIESNTIINITSEFVSLTEFAEMGSRDHDVIDIAITGNGATIMCNNSGGVYCESCYEVIIAGITWDQCGDPSTPNSAGLQFVYNANLFIIACVFQRFRVCRTIEIYRPIGNVSIIDSVIHHNSVDDVFPCKDYSNVHIWNTLANISFTMSGSVFYHNGHTNQPFKQSTKASSMIYYSKTPTILTILIENTLFSSNGVLGMFLYDTAISSYITLVNVTAFNNSNGGVLITALNNSLQLNILSSNFSYNINGALRLELDKKFKSSCYINDTSFIGNTGDDDGVALYFEAITNETDISLSRCIFDSNTGNNIVHAILNSTFINYQCKISVTACNFTRNRIGSALHLSQCLLYFYDFNLLEGNSAAQRGAAIYFKLNSQVTIGNGATVQFTDNTASVYGGAIYADLDRCLGHGVLFKSVSNYNSVTFVNNSAGVSGNSIYFNIPAYVMW